MREKLLISACLLGENCRYDGGGNYAPEVEALRERFELIPVCPERLGGLPTPRTPSERVGERVLTRSGEDVTEPFRRGAARALAAARAQGAVRAVLKERSPSCGSGCVYDGTFTGRVVPGRGVAAELLARHGIEVYSEENFLPLLCEGEREGSV